MKLNNKGIAFSTILYASLSLVIIILIMMLSISRFAKKENTFYKEEIEKNLSKCVNEEIELESCYSLGNNCNKTQYHACLGITENSKNDGLIASEYLKGVNGENVVQSTSNGLSKDIINTSRYIYKGNGNAVKNYIIYDAKTFRIVSIEADGSLKLIYIGNDTPTLKWDDLGGRDWNSSSLKHFLNNEILHSFSDISKMKSDRWESTIVYPSQSLGSLTVGEFNSQKISQSNSYNASLIGLLSIDDYMKSALSINCQNNMLTETSCSSWLADYSGITLNVNGDSTSNKYYFYDGKLSEISTNQSKKVNYAITLNRNVIIVNGEGTISNPFKIK